MENANFIYISFSKSKDTYDQSITISDLVNQKENANKKNRANILEKVHNNIQCNYTRYKLIKISEHQVAY